MSTKVKKPLTEKQQTKRTITIALIVMVVLVAASIVGAIAYSRYLNNGGPQRRLISVESENYEVNNCMLTYWYFSDLYSFNENYGSYAAYLAPSQQAPVMTSSLAAQYYDYGTSTGTPQTWHEYFLNQTLTKIQTALCYAEEAHANNFKYDNLEKDIDAYIDNMKKDATAENLDLDAYIEKFYGSSVKERDIRDTLEIQLISSKYLESVKAEKKGQIPEADLEAYKTENAATITKASYYFYTFGKDIAEDATEEEKNAVSTEAKANADALLASINAAADFDTKVTAFKDGVKSYLTTKNENAETPVTAEELETQIESATAELTNKTREDTFSDGLKADNSDFGAWAYDEPRTAGDATVVETGTGIYTVFLITKPAAADDESARTVHHILFASDDYASDDEAKAAAEAALAEFRKGENSAEAFKKFGEDNYVTSYARFEDMVESTASETYDKDFLAWMFDEARSVGDSGVVKTQFGYHVMYLENDQPAWKATAIKSLIDGIMETYETDITTKYKDTIEINEDNIWKIADCLPESAFTSDATTTTTAATEAASVEHDHDGDGVADHDASEHVDETDTDAVTDTADSDTVADSESVDSDSAAA